MNIIFFVLILNKLFHCPIVSFCPYFHPPRRKTQMWSEELCCCVAFLIIEKLLYHGMHWIVGVNLNFHGTKAKPFRV